MFVMSESVHACTQEEPLWHEKGPRGPHMRQNTMAMGDAAHRTIAHSLGGRGGYGGEALCKSVGQRKELDPELILLPPVRLGKELDPELSLLQSV
eukprot:1141640-Pelagomonas_calceolata.AAC.4